MFKHYSVIILLLAVSIKSWGQYDAYFTHYWAMEPSFNPAAVGKDAKLNIVGAYSMALTGFTNSPKTMYTGADIPFYAMKSYHGVGAEFMNDAIGLFTHKKIALKYAYRRSLGGGMMSAGIQLGFLSESFDGSKVDAENKEDFPTSSADGSSLDVAAGLYYSKDKWYLGASVQHLTSPLIYLGDKSQMQVDMSYYLTGGYNIRLHNPFVTIHPSFLVRSDGVGYRADVTARVKYTNNGKMLYGGFSYSPTNSVTMLLGGVYHGVVLGYSYEAYTSAIGMGNGAHELFIGYQKDINLFKKGRNKHKSVRLL